jgi:serine/threonine protein kinase
MSPPSKDYRNLSSSQTSLTRLTLLRYTNQIADAMDFISRKKIIHGDLAARNILLSDPETCKVTDFGLSRKLYEYGEYVKQSCVISKKTYMSTSRCIHLLNTYCRFWILGTPAMETFSSRVPRYTHLYGEE